MQSIARQRSRVQPVATDPVRNGIDRAQVAFGCNAERVAAAACYVAAPLLSCAEADEPEGSSGGTDAATQVGLLQCELQGLGSPGPVM